MGSAVVVGWGGRWICDLRVRKIDGGYVVGLSGDGVGDGDCMGGSGVVLSGETNGVNDANRDNRAKWAN